MEPTPSPLEAATRIFAALRERDLTIIQTADHPDVVDDIVAIGEFRGVDAVRGFFAELFTAFPDFDLEVVHMVGDAEHAVVQWHATGTLTGTPYYDGLGFARADRPPAKGGIRCGQGDDCRLNAGTDVRTQIRQRVKPTVH